MEERGRTGELRADREVVVTLTHQDFTPAKSFTLKTDAKGLVGLGALTGIATVTARSAGGVERTVSVLPPNGMRASLPSSLNVKAGVPVQFA